MTTQAESAATEGGAAVARPPSWSELAAQPLTIGVLLMTAGGGATGLALLSYGFAEQDRGSTLRRLFEAAFEYQSAAYGLAAVFLLVSVLFLVLRDDRVAPLTFGLLSVGVLLVIPLAALVLDIAPWTFGGRLTSGSLTQLTLIFGPLIALVGWIIAAYAAGGSDVRRKPAATAEPSSPSSESDSVDEA
jgi:hypothetical protein